MSKHRIIFPCSIGDGELQVFVNGVNEISIWIDNEFLGDSFVSLDKSTAIKLSRVLKAEISKIEEEGGQDNG